MTPVGKLEGKSSAGGPPSRALPLRPGNLPWVQHRHWSCFQWEPASPKPVPKRHAPFAPELPNGRFPVKPLPATSATGASRWAVGEAGSSAAARTLLEILTCYLLVADPGPAATQKAPLTPLLPRPLPCPCPEGIAGHVVCSGASPERLLPVPRESQGRQGGGLGCHR